MKRLLFLLVLAVLPVSGFAASAIITTNGSDCSVSTRCLVVSLPQDKGGATLTLSGTWTGTMQFEATGDGGITWSSVNVLPLNSTTAVTSSTSNGTWQVNMSGFTGIRIRSSASMTGSAVATITPSAASFAQRVTGGSGGIGNANYTGTQNVLAKGDATAHTLIDSSCTDDGTNPVGCTNGFNSGGAGFSDQPGTNANPGTTLNKMACINGSQQLFTCGTGNTSGTAGVAIAGAGNSGTPTICITQCPVIYDNQTVIGHVAIVSTTAAGQLHDTGSSAQVSGVDNFIVDAVNSGAGTSALTDILTPRNFSYASTTLSGSPQVWSPTFPAIATAQVWATLAPTNATFPANFSGIAVHCGTAPGGTVTFTLVDVTNSNTTLGTFGVTSGCAITAASTTGGIAQNITAKDLLTLTSGTDVTAVNMAFWFSATVTH